MLKQYKITNIKKVNNNSKKYDISVNKNHNFFANNILVHNCQNFPAIIDEINNTECYYSTKLDGTSATYALEKKKGNVFQRWLWKITNNDYKFHVCSRHFSLREGKDVYWEMAKKYKLKDILMMDKGNIILQGEICGPGINGNALGLSNKDLFIFNVYNTTSKRLVSVDTLIAYCIMHNLKSVPIFPLKETIRDIPHALELATGLYEGTKTPIEGIVIRSNEPTYSKVLNSKLSIKVLNNDYLENVEQ